jgi:hypothetical protein
MSTQSVTHARAFPRIASRFRLAPTFGMLALLTLCACVTRTLDNRGLDAIPAPADTSAVGVMIVLPEDRALGSRIIRFDNTGGEAEHATRRAQADSAMALTCDGNYRSTAEGPAAVKGVVTSRVAGTAIRASEFWYIQYVCVQDAPASREQR